MEYLEMIWTIDVLQTATNTALRKSSDPQRKAALDEVVGNLEVQGQLD